MLTVLIDMPWVYPGLTGIDDTYTVKKNAAGITLDVLSNDYDYLNGQRSLLSISAVTAPQSGSVNISADGRTIEYLAERGFLGIDEFSYTVTNEQGNQEQVSVLVNVIEPLFATGDWFRVDEGSSSNELDVLKNDRLNVDYLYSAATTDLKLRIVEVGTADIAGTVTISADGQRLIYSPAEGFAGLETLFYTMENEEGYRAIARAQVQVTTVDGSTPHLWKEQFKQRLLENVVRRWEFVGQQSWWRWTVIVEDSFSNGGGAQLAAADRSSTNVQVQGVDEGDIVKTDGSYLYVLSNWKDESAASHQLSIIDIRDPANMAVVSRVSFEQELVELYLHEDRLTALSQSADDIQITLLDLSDRADPQLISESTLAGRLIESRAIGDYVYVFADGNNRLLPMPLQFTSPSKIGFHETRQQFVDRIGDNFFEELLEVETRQAAGEVEQWNLLDEAQLVGLGDSAYWNQFSTVATFSATGEQSGLIAATTFAHSGVDVVYASAEDLYVLGRSKFSGLRMVAPVGWSTRIDKFSFDDTGEVNWSAAGTVDGHVLNQFSVDEHDGYLRVATTSGWYGESALYVLQQDGDQLDVVGSVEDLAPGERIYAVRFDGDRGFIVTFRKVDPLFAFDLRDPTNPQALGALKISGYSNYLHMIDENHVLGIGREASEQGLYQEIQVSLFDISDMTDPKLVDRYSFEGGRDLWSPIMAGAWNLGDHHSVSYFESHQTLVLPVYPSIWSSASVPAEISMRLLKIDPESGIELLGQVDFESPLAARHARSVRVGDVLFSISPDTVLASDLRAPANLLGQLNLSSANEPPGTPVQALEPLRVLHNAADADDVNGDGHFSAIDILHVINALNSRASGSTPGRISLLRDSAAAGETRTSSHPDVNNDGYVTPLDALLLINRLNAVDQVFAEAEAYWTESEAREANKKRQEKLDRLDLDPFAPAAPLAPLALDS